MNINIRGDKIEITDSIKQYVKEKLARLNRYFDDVSKIDAHVLVRVRNNEQIIEVTIPTGKYTYKREIGGEMIEKVMYGELGKGIPKN